MSGIETAAQVVEQVEMSHLLEEAQRVDVESMGDSCLSFSWNKPETQAQMETPASTTQGEEALEKMAASLNQLARPVTTSAVKNTYIEERLMRSHIKFQDTVRHIMFLVEVFSDLRADPSWMGQKLLHELQDFVEVDRMRTGLRGLPFEIRQQLEIEKIKLILFSVLINAAEDPHVYPPQNLV